MKQAKITALILASLLMALFASPPPIAAGGVYTYVSSYDNVKGTVDNFDNQKQVNGGYSTLTEGVTVVWDNYAAQSEPSPLVDNSFRWGESLSSLSDAQTLDGIYENIAEENNEEHGSPYLGIVQGGSERDVANWWGWIVVNPTGSQIEVTEVRIKDDDGATDWVWTIDVQGYPTSGWVDGGVAGLYWSGSETIPAHSAKYFRVRAQSNLDLTPTPSTASWTAIVDGENFEKSTSIVVGSNDTWGGGMFYNLPDNAIEQPSGVSADGLYALIDVDENGDNLSAGTEYLFYINICEWTDGKGYTAVGATLEITVPKEFAGLGIVDNTDFTDATISGGGAENWTILGHSVNQIGSGAANPVDHFSFKATTPSGYNTRTNWEIDTRFSGTDLKKLEPVYLICEADVLVQPDASLGYSLNWGHRIEGVPSDGDNYKVTVHGYADTDENIGVYVWNSRTGSWEFIDNLPTAQGSSITYLLDNIENYSVDNDVSIKYEDYDDTDATQTTIHIDHSATNVWKESPSLTPVSAEPLVLLVDDSVRMGENSGSLSGAQILDSVYENIAEEHSKAENGSPYLAIVQGAPEKGSSTWWGWVVVNPSDSEISVTEVRVKDNAGTDWVWTVNVQGYPSENWAAGGVDGLYWTGYVGIPAHSAAYFRVRVTQDAINEVIDHTMIWTANTSSGNLEKSSTVIGVDKGSWGGIYYNQPNDTTEQTEAVTFEDGLYAYLDVDENGDNLAAGTEYLFYINVHEWAGKTILTGGTLTITIPKEFTSVALVDSTDFSDAAVTGGGAENWIIQGTNDSAITNGVIHLSFNATTPATYTTRSNWEFDTRFTGTGAKPETIRYICEASVSVQASSISVGYSLNWEHRITNVPNRVSHKVRIYGYADSGENFSIYTWDGSSWQDSTYNLPISIDWVEYDIDNSYVQNGIVSIKYDDDTTGDDTAENIRIDYCVVESTSATYSVEIYENIDNVISGDNYYLEIKYMLDSTNDNFKVQVWNGSAWNDRGNTLDNSAGWEEWSYTLLANELTGTGDDVNIRFVDTDGELTDINALLLDYVRVRSYSAAVGLGKPILVSPENATETSDNTPTFTWENGANATYHRLVIDNSPDFSDGDNIYDNANIYDNTCTIENELPPDNYWWHVAAGNGGIENWSENTWRIEIIPYVPPEWQVIETWTGTVTAPVAWQLIETWTGTVSAPAEWKLIESWTGTVQAPAEWQVIETWTGTVSAPAAWSLIETWAGTVSAPAAWQLIETWIGTVEASVAWQLIETWTGIVQAPVAWQVVETWTGTVNAPAQWNLIETWIGTVIAPAGWQLTEMWTGTVEAPALWRLIESWMGVVEAPLAWQLVETWVGTVEAVGTPSSGIGAISPYWQTSASYAVTATALDPDGIVVTVTLWYRYSAEGSDWSAWTPFGTDNESPWVWSFTAPEDDGYYEFYSVAKDNDNNEELAPAVADVQYGVDRVAPTITSVIINDNAGSTSSVDVTISINASDATSGLAEMRFSLNNAEWSDWGNFTENKSYILPTGDGLKTVYVQVKDKAGLLSIVASDSITLETFAPPAPLPPVVVPPSPLPPVPTPPFVPPIFYTLLAIFPVGISGLALYRVLTWRIKPFVSLKSLKRVVPAGPAVNLARLKALWRIKPAISLERMMPAPITMASDLPTGPFKPIPVVTRPPAVGPRRVVPKAMTLSEILERLKRGPRPSKPRISLKRLKREVFKEKKRRRS